MQISLRNRILEIWGVIIEVKYAHDGDLDAACREVLRQIEHTRYEDGLSDEGVENVLKYGIACYKSDAGPCWR